MESLYSEEESLGAHVITTRGLEQKKNTEKLTANPITSASRSLKTKLKVLLQFHFKKIPRDLIFPFFSANNRHKPLSFPRCLP